MCCKPNIETATHHYIRAKKDFIGSLAPYTERHRRCFRTLREFKQSWWRDGKLQMHGPASSTYHDNHRDSRLDLSLLRVCRQIHEEAALIPYAFNTFAFDEGLDLDLFVSRSLLAPQRKAIQSLQINGWLEGYNRFPGVLPATVKLLQDLKCFTLSVSGYRSKRVEGPHLFSQLALKEARVIVELDSRDSNIERRKSAKKIEHHLLAESRRIASFTTKGVTDQKSATRALISRIPTCPSCSNILVLKWTCQWLDDHYSTFRSPEDAEHVSCSACGSAIDVRNLRPRMPSSAARVAELLKTAPQKLYKVLPR